MRVLGFVQSATALALSRAVACTGGGSGIAVGETVAEVCARAAAPQRIDADPQAHTSSRRTARRGGLAVRERAPLIVFRVDIVNFSSFCRTEREFLLQSSGPLQVDLRGCGMKRKARSRGFYRLIGMRVDRSLKAGR